MTAVNSAVVVDAGHAPEILIFRFTRWPSLDEQRLLLKNLVDNQLFSADSAAVINITALDVLPDPDALAAALAQATGGHSVLKRVACVVETLEQTLFVQSLRMMAPQPSKVGVFSDEANALQWLIERPMVRNSIVCVKCHATLLVECGPTDAPTKTRQSFSCPACLGWNEGVEVTGHAICTVSPDPRAAVRRAD